MGDLNKGVLVNEFFKILSDGGWHSLYSFHEKYRLSPDQIIIIVDHLLSENLIKTEGGYLSINKKVSLSDYLRLRKTVISRKFSISRLDDMKLGKKEKYYTPDFDKIEESIVLDNKVYEE